MDLRALGEALLATAITPLGSLVLVAIGIIIVVLLVRRYYRDR